MKLGTYFTLEELTVTNSGLPNVPNSVEIANLKSLVTNILDPLRKEFGMPIKVNSGYRSQAVNKAVGGAASSQHVKGQAADITSSDNKKLFELIRAKFKFTQLINEKNLSWIHVSYDSANLKNQVLKFDGKKYVQI